MNGITALYSANVSAMWRQMNSVAKANNAPTDKNGRTPGANPLPRDTVTISDEARAMSAAASHWAGAFERTGGNPAGVELREAAGRRGRGPEAESAGKGRGAGASAGTRGAEETDDNADAIAELKRKIRTIQREIAEFMLKPWDDEAKKRQVMSKRLELMTLQDQLARLESEQVTMII